MIGLVIHLPQRKYYLSCLLFVFAVFYYSSVVLLGFTIELTANLLYFKGCFKGFICLNVWPDVCLCSVYMPGAHPWRPEDAIRSPATGVSRQLRTTIWVQESDSSPLKKQ